MHLKFNSRLRATGLHLVISVVIAALCAALVFGVWYPPPYSILAGGMSLFMLITTVDVVVGPVLTFVVFNLEKTRSHLSRDLFLIAVLQLVALIYGVWTVFEARPVFLAAENRLFRVVAANEIDLSELHLAPPAMRSLSLTGPKLIGVRSARNGQEKMEAIERALEGYDGAARPSFWEPYSESKKRIQEQLLPISDIGVLEPSVGARITHLRQSINKSENQIGYLPVKARAQDWVVIIQRDSAEVLELLPLRD